MFIVFFRTLIIFTLLLIFLRVEQANEKLLGEK